MTQSPPPVYRTAWLDEEQSGSGRASMESALDALGDALEETLSDRFSDRVS